MSTILVTGAAGVIGRALVPALRTAGFQVRELDRASGPAIESNLPLEGVSGVIHLAACARVAEAEASPARAQRDNVDATAILVEALVRRPNAPWLVFASSREVYGSAELLPVTETAAVAPRNTYGRTKADAEALLTGASGLRSTVLRLANVYGAPWDHADRLVPSFVRAAISGGPLLVHGSSRTLDLVHIRDVVGAFVAVARAMEEGRTLPGVINVCSGVETSLTALAAAVLRHARSNSPILHTASASHEVDRFVGDNSLARARLRWSPSTELAVGLAELVTPSPRPSMELV